MPSAGASARVASVLSAGRVFLPATQALDTRSPEVVRFRLASGNPDGALGRYDPSSVTE